MATTDRTPDQHDIEAERRKLQRAADFARASVGLEGFTPSAEAETKVAALIAESLEAMQAKGT
jgi:hypothetical protein